MILPDTMIVKTSFEDFFYVALGLLWVVYSFYNAKKKKEAKNKTKSKYKNKSFFETIISELVPNELQPEPAIRKSTKVENIIEDNVKPDINTNGESVSLFSYNDEYEERNKEQSLNVTETEPVTIISKRLSDKSNKKIEHSIKKNITRKRINLKQAVIYSEILKRVYF